MNAVTKEQQNALSLPERAAVALGESANATKLRELAAKSAGIVTVTNPDGRDEAHRAGMVLRRTRTDITNTGKAAREDATAFSKAVIAMEKDLIAIIEPEELRVLALRDAFDAEEKARKDALIAAERARVEVIQADIQSIRDLVTMAAGKPSHAIAAAIEVLRLVQMTGGRFEEFADAAIQAVAQTGDKLGEMYDAALEAEAAALAAEQARIAEAARLEAERVELARQRAENERIANEQAAERQRLADLATAQALAAKQLADKAAANLKAERDAQELAMKIEREKAQAAQAERERVAADTKRQLDEQQAQIATDRAALVREQEEAAARVVAAAQLEADHAAALIESAERDAEHAADIARCEQTAQAMLTQGRSLIAESVEAYADAGLDDPELSDEEIAAMGVECGMEPMAWVERLEVFTARARAELMVAA